MKNLQTRQLILFLSSFEQLYKEAHDALSLAKVGKHKGTLAQCTTPRCRKLCSAVTEWHKLLGDTTELEFDLENITIKLPWDRVNEFMRPLAGE